MGAVSPHPFRDRLPVLTLDRALAVLTCLALFTGCKSSETEGEPLDERAGSRTTAEPHKAKPAAKPDLLEAPAEESEPAPAPLKVATLRADTPPTDGPRVYAKSRHVWIRSMPTSDVQWIGFLWWGGSVKIRDEKRVPGAGCKKEWVPVEPRGWVCVDDKRATENPRDEELVSIFPFRPDVNSPWPHKYAAVHAPTRRYESAPDGLPVWLDPSLSGKKPPLPFSLPVGLSEGHTHIESRSAITYAAEADFGDRAFLLTGDLNWVPKDRVEILSPSEFQGVPLSPAGFHLPLAFFRGKDRPAFKQTAAGGFEPVPEHFRRLNVVQLSSDYVQDGRTTYYRLEGEPLWVSSREAVVPTPKTVTPWGENVGKEAGAHEAQDAGADTQGRKTWLEASILGGWLVAFEGTRPVYATMISAGRGGTPHPDKDPLETASTPTGKYSIGGKFRTATMLSSSTPIVHMDVPWTQNFSGPHAIHSAYWHDDWGSLKSAGCVNVSPLDGKWLFEFSEPEVPEGWHGVRYVSRYGGGSTVFLLHE